MIVAEKIELLRLRNRQFAVFIPLAQSFLQGHYMITRNCKCLISEYGFWMNWQQMGGAISRIDFWFALA